MTKLKEFNLALGVINNIVLIDRDNHVVFAGDEIRSLLFYHSSEIKPRLFDNFVEPEIVVGLTEKIDEARREKHTCHFTFDTLGETILIFPANYDESDHLILATRNQLILANKIESDLRERVKELECLYSISNQLESAGNLTDALTPAIESLVKAIKYPDFVTACFIIDGIKYGTEESEEARDQLNIASAHIKVSGVSRGKLEICYHQGAEFLPEEMKLIREIGLMVTRALEKEDYRKKLEEKRILLLEQNDELTQLTDSLKTSNRKLNALFNAITDKLVMIDSDYNIDMSNKDELGIGDKCYRKLFNFSEPCEYCPAVNAFRTRDTATAETRLGDRYYLLKAYPVLDNKGKTDRVIEICRNVTIEKQIEAQLIQSYKLASIGKLTAGVAHEINNPNTFIRGNIKIINEAIADIIPILDQVYREKPDLKIARLNYQLFKENINVLIEDMMGGADRIKKIVDGLRNFARKEEGGLTDDVDINDIIENNLRITEKEIRKNARIKQNLAPNIPRFKGNITKLEQVLMNMLVNASHAINHDRGVIVIETEFDQTANEVIIRISDNGKGIEEKNMRYIFDPFFTTKRNNGGTGLGLSISYGIIQEHQGRIHVESELGKGTTFSIFIPVTQPSSK